MFSWKNKRVLITGATGFVGSHLYKRLLGLGANVYGVSRSKEDDNIYKLNVANFSELNELIGKKKIEICFHLAGEALVENGQKDPYGTFKVNMEGALNILEISRKNNLKRVIIASTAHVYGKNTVPYIEEYTPKPSRPYETSKACTDLISQSYADTFNLPVLIARFVNIYGPGDTNYSRLIPKTIKSILNDKNPAMWGGGAKRQYLYIDDAVDAYINLAKLDEKMIGRNRIYNFGSGDPISVRDLIKKIIDLSGKDLNIEKLAEERLDEISSQYVSAKKASRDLGWNPKYSLDSGILKTISWYRGQFKK